MSVVRPSQVVILGQAFEVRWLRESEVTTKPRITTEVRAGRASVSYQWIAVDAEQGPDQLRDTLLHEVLHVATGLLDDELDEQVINRLSPVLLDAMRVNPELVAFLLEDSA